MLTAAIFVINVVLHRPVLDALLFSLAIAVGISPQLLPGGRLHQPGRRVPPAGPAQGAGQAAGLHRGPGRHRRAVHRQDRHADRGQHRASCGRPGPDGRPVDEPLLLGLLCNEAVVEGGRAAGGTPSTSALWDSPAAAAAAGGAGALPAAGHAAVRPRTAPGLRRWSEDDRGNRMVITKGAPGEPARALRRRSCRRRATRWRRSSRPATGWSPWPPATRPASPRSPPADEHGLDLRGLLVFLDPPKPDARAALRPAGQARASRSRSSPATTRSSRPRSAPTSACRPGGVAHRRRHRRRWTTTARRR